MNELFSGWTEFIKLIEENMFQMIKNPVIWILAVLILIGIYGLFNVSSKTKQNSFANIIRQLLQVLFDTTGDLLNAFKSVTGFISVLRLLLFGKLNKRTLNVLTNYAIIFLSMASFTTTYNGLNNVVDNIAIAAFISFGVQVSILIYSIKLQHKLLGIKDDEDTKTQIKYSFRDDILNVCKFQNGNILKNDKGKNNDTTDFFSKKVASIIYVFVLIMCMFISSFFSYLFMFEKFVDNQLPYDDYFRSVLNAHEISNEYSMEMATYASELISVLSQYNSKIENWLELQDNSPMVAQENLQNIKDEIEAIEEDIEDAIIEMERSELGSEEYNIAAEILDRYESDLENLRERYNDEYNSLLYDSDYQNRLAAYKNIQELNSFYNNPIYLRGIDTGVKTDVEWEVIISMNVATISECFFELQRAEASFRDTTNIQEHAQFNEQMTKEIEKVFNNYLQLSTFYARQGKQGIDFSEISAILGTVGNVEFDQSGGTEEQAKEYQNKANEILQKMIQIMNEIPIIASVKNIWTNKSIVAPKQTQYLKDTYDLYRDNSGTTQNFERAFSKLFGENNEKTLLARELAFLALAIDSTIIILSFIRGKKSYTTNASDLRRLVGILFLDDSLDKETELYEKSESLSVTIGIMSGIFCYALYKISGASQGISVKSDIISLLLFVGVGFVLGLLLHWIYQQIRGKEKSWRDERLYLKWKKIWTEGIANEKELEERILQFKNGIIPKGLELNEEDIRNIIEFWEEEQEEGVFVNYFYKEIIDLFSKLEMKECYKVTFFRKIKEGKTVNLDYESEKIILPCLKESDIEGACLKSEFYILCGRRLAGVDYIIEQNDEKEYWFILTERFWGILYDAILLRVIGGRLSDYDIEEELQDNAEEEEYY